MHPLVIALFATRLLPAPAPAEQMPARVKGVLQYLTSVAPAADATGKEYRLRKPIEPAILSDYVSARGLSFVYVAGGAPSQVRRDQLEKELKRGHGLIYRHFVGLAINAARYQDYSNLPWVRKDGIVSVTLSSYNLSFALEDDVLKLVGIEFTDPGGD